MPEILRTPLLTVNAECSGGEVVVRWEIGGVGGTPNHTSVECGDKVVGLIGWLETLRGNPPEFEPTGWAMAHREDTQRVTETFRHEELEGRERRVRILYDTLLEEIESDSPRTVYEGACSWVFTGKEVDALATGLLGVIRECCP